MLVIQKIKQYRCHASHDVITLLLAIIHNSTTRTLLLKEKMIVRIQIYKSQSFSENKEQTQELFFNVIIDLSNENLNL